MSFLNSKGSNWLIAVLVVQLFLVLVGFQHHFSQPQDALFHDDYDGFKNYTTFYTYVEQSPSEHFPIGYYNGMNYPYGDNVFFTDNTPFLSVPIRWINQHVIDLGEANIPLFNYFILLGIILSSLFLFLILKRWLSTPWLISIGALTLPWISPQIMRLSNGHFNLSQSWLILACIYFSIRLYESIVEDRSKWYNWLLLGLMIYVSALYHIYFLAINGVMIFFIFASLFILSQNSTKRFQLLLQGGFACSLGLGLFILNYLLISPDIFNSDSVTTGFDLDSWRLTWSSLFTSYSHFGIDYIIKSREHFGYETNSYLGAFALFSGTLFLIIKRWLPFKGQSHNHLLMALGIAGIVSLFTSLGVRIAIPNTELVIENFLSPFFWLKKVSGVVENFRCLSRFNWPFFLIVNIFILILVERWIKNDKYPVIKWIGIILPIFLLLDAKDSIRFNRKEVYKNVLMKSDMEVISNLSKGINFGQYEAILPIPYFHVGSGNWNSTFDAFGNMMRRSAQMSVRSGLPLMASQMSRSSTLQADLQCNIFRNPGESSLRDMHTTKRVLILYDEGILHQELEKAQSKNDDKTVAFLEAQLQFLGRAEIDYIKRYGDHYLISFNPQELLQQ